MVSALSFAFFAGIVLGVLAARDVNRWQDTLISHARPDLLRHPLLLVRADGDRRLFACISPWLPAGGFEDIGAGLTGFARTLDIARHLVLPTLTLALIYLAIYLRLMRGLRCSR